jgi:hypothetical protein
MSAFWPLQVDNRCENGSPQAVKKEEGHSKSAKVYFEPTLKVPTNLSPIQETVDTSDTLSA